MIKAKPFNLEKNNKDYGVTKTIYRCKMCNKLFLYSCEGYGKHYKETGHFPTPGINRIVCVKKLFIYRFPFNLFRGTHELQISRRRWTSCSNGFFKWVNVEKEEIQKEQDIKKKIKSIQWSA